MPPEADRPGPHPEPPDDLTGRPLPLLVLAATWYRIHRVEYEPLFFGRSGSYRFDAPAGEYGVLYAGDTSECAFVETFGHTTGIRLVHVADLRVRGLARVEPRTPLRFVDLTGSGLARLGADERLCAGDYRVAQRWALAFWRHPMRADGVAYRSRHDPSRLCAAVFERAAPLLTATRLGSLADPAHRQLLANLLDTYDFGLLER